MNRAISSVIISRAELTFSLVLHEASTETIAPIVLTQKKNVSTNTYSGPPSTTPWKALLSLWKALCMVAFSRLCAVWQRLRWQSETSGTANVIY